MASATGPPGSVTIPLTVEGKGVRLTIVGSTVGAAVVGGEVAGAALACSVATTPGVEVGGIVEDWFIWYTSRRPRNTASTTTSATSLVLVIHGLQPTLLRTGRQHRAGHRPGS